MDKRDDHNCLNRRELLNNLKSKLFVSTINWSPGSACPCGRGSSCCRTRLPHWRSPTKCHMLYFVTTQGAFGVNQFKFTSFMQDWTKMFNLITKKRRLQQMTYCNIIIFCLHCFSSKIHMAISIIISVSPVYFWFDLREAVENARDPKVRRSWTPHGSWQSKGC